MKQVNSNGIVHTFGKGWVAPLAEPSADKMVTVGREAISTDGGFLSLVGGVVEMSSLIEVRGPAFAKYFCAFATVWALSEFRGLWRGTTSRAGAVVCVAVREAEVKAARSAFSDDVVRTGKDEMFMGWELDLED